MYSDSSDDDGLTSDLSPELVPTHSFEPLEEDDDDDDSDIEIVEVRPVVSRSRLRPVEEMESSESESSGSEIDMMEPRPEPSKPGKLRKESNSAEPSMSKGKKEPIPGPSKSKLRNGEASEREKAKGTSNEDMEGVDNPTRRSPTPAAKDAEKVKRPQKCPKESLKQESDEVDSDDDDKVFSDSSGSDDDGKTFRDSSGNDDDSEVEKSDIECMKTIELHVKKGHTGPTKPGKLMNGSKPAGCSESGKLRKESNSAGPNMSKGKKEPIPGPSKWKVGNPEASERVKKGTSAEDMERSDTPTRRSPAPVAKVRRHQKCPKESLKQESDEVDSDSDDDYETRSIKVAETGKYADADRSPVPVPSSSSKENVDVDSSDGDFDTQGEKLATEVMEVVKLDAKESSTTCRKTKKSAKKDKNVWDDRPKKRRRKKKKTKEDAAKRELKEGPYYYSCHAQEDHGYPIYGCDLFDGDPTLMATVGRNRVSIYECTDADKSLKLLQCFEDPDETEDFYTCVWTVDKEGTPIIAAGGKRGVIRIFSPGSCIRDLVSHTKSVNHLTIHPKDPALLISAASDRSVRMWNVYTGHLVVIFYSDDGHRDEVLYADVDPSGSKLVTGGIDHLLIVWDLTAKEIEVCMSLSHVYDDEERSFPTRTVYLPAFVSKEIHGCYIDCVKWFGSLVFSKSCENQLICWKAGEAMQDWDEVLKNPLKCKDYTIVACLELPECELWFVRFALNPDKRILAVGNQFGTIYIFDLDVENVETIERKKLIHPLSDQTIRQTALSRDGKILIAVDSKATIWRWDMK